jgi:thiamine-phosphate pyrophosphorylase
MSSLRADRVARFAATDIYPVTSQAFSGDRSSLEVLDAIIAGGARVVQLREKELGKRPLYELAVAFRHRTAAAGVLLLINDHLDIALAVDADGVHLGQDDLPIPVARRLAPDLLIGASTHSIEEAERAQQDGADVINIGPIYPTGTKALATRFLGVEGLLEVAPHARCPFSVMGGIKLDNLAPLLAAGARTVAVVTAVTMAPDPAAATRAFRDQIMAARTSADRSH